MFDENFFAKDLNLGSDAELGLFINFCRSATFNPSSGDCRISNMDRHTVAGTAAFAESPADEYLESNCADDPVKLCDFQLLENRIMKTVDSVYQVNHRTHKDT